MRLQIAEKLKNGEFDGIAELAEMKRSAAYDSLLRAYETLRTERLYQSAYHGTDHVERVMLLGAVIASRQRFTPRQTELLLLACSYHDVGRINDDRDEDHGRRSADMLPSIPGLSLGAGELRCVQAAVATHSAPDRRLDFFAEAYGVAQEDLGLCRLLCKALKDADNLDRVRIRDLDTRHLRFAESKAMKNAAEAIWQISRK